MQFNQGALLALSLGFNNSFKSPYGGLQPAACVTRQSRINYSVTLRLMNYTDCFIESYVHNGGIGVLIELGVSDPLVVKSDAFKHLAKDLAMHIAAMAPTTVDDLMQQPFAKDPELTISQLVAKAADDFREKITILRFVRWSTDSQEPLQPEPPKSPAVIYNLRNPR